MPPTTLDCFDLSGVKVPKPKLTAFSAIDICPFTIIVDSREQMPFDFDGITGRNGESIIVPSIVRGLSSGDYSIQGFEASVAVERKSLTDLYGSVTHGRDRFEREIERLNDFEAAFVVIEAGWQDILFPAEFDPSWENRTEPRSVEGTIVAWSIRYPKVHWWPCGSRNGAQQRTFSILKRFWEEKRK